MARAQAKDKALKQLWRDAKDRGYKPESDESTKRPSRPSWCN